MSTSVARSSGRQAAQRFAQQAARARELNGRLNAFTHLYPVQEPADAKTEGSGSEDRSLAGISVAVKDLFATGDGATTTCASRMLREYRSPLEATVVRRLRDAGATLVGKTNMDEFGMGSANVHSDFGSVVNPAGPDGVNASLALGEQDRRVAGGSSGGSAAAVASGLCDVALASDTGGSTRLPAAYCGVYGFKPSYGRLSRYGMVAYASSLDTVGLMSREADQLWDTFSALDGHDARDPTSIPGSPRTRAHESNQAVLDGFAQESDRPLEGLRIGVPSDLIPQPLLDSPTLLTPFRSFLASLRSLGASIVSVRLPSAPLGLSAYYVLASAEASSNLARYDGVQYGFRAPEVAESSGEEGAGKGMLYAKTRSAGFGKEVKKRILLGTFALSADAFDNYYLQAQRVRRMVQLELDGLFRVPSPLRQAAVTDGKTERLNGVDLLVHPSALSTAPILSAAQASPQGSDGPSKPAQQNSYIQDLLTVPASLTGLPALSVPVGRDAGDGWPVGATLMGQWGSDEVVLEVARRWEVLRKSRGEWENVRD